MSNKISNNIWLKLATKKGICLAIFGFISAVIIAGSWLLTLDKINYQKKIYQEKTLLEIIPKNLYDNSILDSSIKLPVSNLLGTSKQLEGYIAKSNQQPIAVIIPAIAPDGYNGKIELLIGIYANGELAAVRVTKHQETPGLGDKITTDVSDWILAFTGMSLATTTSNSWQVKKDGGAIDQFVGATITPRAVVTAVHKALQYFHEYNTQLLANTQVIENE
jgi:electron transport complex protein RnfG